MNEAETRAEHIDPALRAAGWGVAAVPYEDKSGSHPRRYFQDIAVERVMEAIADGKDRLLLTLATGTGKTFIAFQVAWKLFRSRWNLTREPSAAASATSRSTSTRPPGSNRSPRLFTPYHAAP